MCYRIATYLPISLLFIMYIFGTKKRYISSIFVTRTKLQLKNHVKQLENVSLGGLKFGLTQAQYETIYTVENFCRATGQKTTTQTYTLRAINMLTIMRKNCYILRYSRNVY